MAAVGVQAVLSLLGLLQEVLCFLLFIFISRKYKYSNSESKISVCILKKGFTVPFMIPMLRFLVSRVYPTLSSLLAFCPISQLLLPLAH